VRAYDAKDTRRLPLFLREGAIVPLEVRDDSTGLGDSDAADALSLLLFPGPESKLFLLYDSDDQPTGITAQGSGRSVEVRVSRAPRKLLLMVRLDGKPIGVTANGAALPAVASRADLASQTAAYTYDMSKSLLIVKLPSATTAQQLAISLP
jgi:hypothetical protein